MGAGQDQQRVLPQAAREHEAIACRAAQLADVGVESAEQIRVGLADRKRHALARSDRHSQLQARVGPPRCEGVEEPDQGHAVGIAASAVSALSPARAVSVLNPGSFAACATSAARWPQVRGCDLRSEDPR